MKKILSAAAAFGLVAGMAATASAVDFSVTGRYVVEGYYLSDAAGTGLLPSEVAGLDNGSDAYFVHSLKIAPVLQVNDKVKLVTDFWLADNSVWGNQEDVAGAPSGRALTSNEKDVEVWQAYMEWASPAGKLRVGRMLSGPFGTSFLDTIGHADRIILFPSFLAAGPWSTIVKYQKGTEGDGGPRVANPGEVDADSDYYEFDVVHKTDKGLGIARVGYSDNATSLTSSSTTWTFTVSGDYKLSSFYLASELDYRTGTTEFDAVGTPDIDVERLGFFLQLGTKMGALDVSGMYFYASGDDNASDRDSEAVGALGDEFEPYYILTGSHAGLFNTEMYGNNAAGALARNAGIHSLGVHANYAMSDRLMLHGAAAYAMAADELNTYADGTAANFDDEYGWEFDVGAAYKLLDNLTYEAHFGYLMAGDFFKGDQVLNQALGLNVDAEDVFLVSHHLTMTF